MRNNQFMISRTSIKALINKKSTQIVIMILIGVILGLYYFSNIKKIYTIWEIEDEAGYLFNASLLSKCDWKEVFSNSNAYYGLGYSLLLSPLFYICETGLELIRGAIAVNIICILFLYFIQIYVMSKIAPKCNCSVLAIISGVICLYPYLLCSSMKVICEAFLTLWVWIIGFLLYKSFSTQKYRYFFLLGVATMYSYFIHMRSVAVIAAVGLILLLGLYSKKINLKKVICFLLPFIGCFLILNIFKKEITGILGSGNIMDNTGTNKNIITGKFLSDRIKWLLLPQNFNIYALCAVGKIFYLISSTGGIILFGCFEFICVIRDCFKAGIKKIESNQIVVIFMGSCFLIMFILSCVSGTGETYASFIYGRYYEYTVIFLLFLGVYSLLYRNYQNKILLIFMSITAITGYIAIGLEQFNTSDYFGIDTNRYSGFSYAISKNEDFVSTFLFSALLVGIFFEIYTVLKNKYIKFGVIAVIVLILFMPANKVCLEKINEVNINCKSDIDMAEFIMQNGKDEQVYFVYEPYKYDTFYERMQVFLKNKSMHIILPEILDNVKDNDWVITYINSEKANELREKGSVEYVMCSKNYELFRK